jgi:hypothetical protein
MRESLLKLLLLSGYFVPAGYGLYVYCTNRRIQYLLAAGLAAGVGVGMWLLLGSKPARARRDRRRSYMADL